LFLESILLCDLSTTYSAGKIVTVVRSNDKTGNNQNCAAGTNLAVAGLVPSAICTRFELKTVFDKVSRSSKYSPEEGRNHVKDWRVITSESMELTATRLAGR